MAVHTSITLGLDFAPGVVRKEVKRIHGVPVHPEGKSKHFYLAVSFGRAKFRLDVDSNSEFKAWQRENQEEWTIIRPSNRYVNRALHAMNSVASPVLKSASWGKRKIQNVSFAPIISYEAYKGYSAPDPEKVRYKGCFKLGHILKACPSRPSALSDQHEQLSSSVLAGADTPPLILDGTCTYPTSSSESPDATVERIIKNPNLPSLSFESMANFDLNPAPYVPRGMAIEDGGPFRLQRTFVTLAGAPACRHESYLIAMVEPLPPTEEVPAVIAQVHAYMVEILHYEVVSLRRHPFGLARFCMRNAIDRDVLIQRESTDARVLAKVIYEDATTVPRDIVVREVMVIFFSL
ncbi:hypothetical protein BRADI_2g40961v3 [Brachypodium distachyon]|uniref:DUF7597 domain-containing protein n=1 Tax=Brachypodium distachyon TaxID=15368 RepID=A0A2K2DD38_BRADI|nr:hypothetical protein BRADI_2g40961v3 [Brachypodium distachyon]